MLGKIKNKLENRFAKVWLSILVLVLLVLSARILFFSQRNPGLEEVLAHYQTKPSYDPSLFVAGLLALSLATISAAKGYEIFKRSRSITEAVLPDEEPVEEELRQENAELKEQLDNMASEFEEMSRAAQKLKKAKAKTKIKIRNKKRKARK